jgi:hypothetical protein
MGNILEQVKTFVHNSAATIQAQNGRVALVGYKDAGDPYPAQVLTDFTDSYDTFSSQLDSLNANGGGDELEATLHALVTTMNGVSWRNGAAKSIILLTDTGFHNPDTVDGSTIDDVIKRSQEIDPVSIYPVIPSRVNIQYVTLTAGTSGLIVNSDDGVQPALTSVLAKIQNRAVALLKSTNYKATQGQQITFDASDSYIADANIMNYAWDFDSDGRIDKITSTPIVDYTYNWDFTGNIQVSVYADNGTVAGASAAVTISSEPAPVLPDAPKNVTATVVSTADKKSTVRVSWTADSTVDSWVAQLNNIPLGTINKSQTSFDITDVDRTSDVTVSIAGTNASGTGTFSTATISALPPPPILSTCTQSNFFIRILCRAIALIKYIIQGVVYYVLPYAL